MPDSYNNNISIIAPHSIWLFRLPFTIKAVLFELLRLPAVWGCKWDSNPRPSCSRLIELNTSAAASLVAFQSLHCSWLSNCLLEVEMWLDPLTSEPIGSADWAIESFFQVFPLDAISWLSNPPPQKTPPQRSAAANCSDANALHRLNTPLLKLFNIPTTCTLWKHTRKLGIWKESWTRDLEFSHRV